MKPTHRLLVSDESSALRLNELLRDSPAEDFEIEIVSSPSELARARLFERYELAIRASSDGIWDWDLETGEVDFSSQWKTRLGYADGEIGNSPDEWLGRIHPEDRERVDAELPAHLNANTPVFVSEHRLRHKDETYRWVQTRGLAARDRRGKPHRLVGTLRDVTERRTAEEQLRQGAFYDALTGLSNRAVLMDRLGRSIEQAKRRGDHEFALLFSDLDGFKRINDSLGHGVGDELLVAVARRLEKCVRTVDTLARVGGDEFAIILDDIRDISDALRVAERIKESLREPFQIGQQDVVVGSSIGIASSAGNYDRCDQIMRDADTAMYRAKSKGKGRHEIFDKTMHVQAVDRLTLETELRQGLRNEQLRVHYQPIVSLPTGRLEALEALVRWEHPEQGLISPAKFIPLAEESGMIIELDRWVLLQACRQMKSWHDRFPREPPLVISTNLSPRQLSQPDFVDQIIHVLDETGLEPRCFRPEITESVLMENLKVASDVLDRLSRMNVLLHVDDFGTGYSSLSYLLQFRVSTLKIDGSFVSHMESGGESVEIVRMIVSLAHNLGMKVIAEGVETAGQLEQLRRLGCEYGQGYFFSRPMTGEQVEELLTSMATGNDADWLGSWG